LEATSKLVSPVCVFKVNDVKCIAQMTLSNHHNPLLTPVREIRTKRTTNEVQCWILNQPSGSPHSISSLEELEILATNFFSVKVCHGVPYDAEINDIKTIKAGFKNCLNRWESTSCEARKVKINAVDSSASVCSYCNRLQKALLVKAMRYFCY